MDFKFYTKITVASIYLYPKCVAIETMIMGVVSRLTLTSPNVEHKTTLASFNLSVY